MKTSVPRRSIRLLIASIVSSALLASIGLAPAYASPAFAATPHTAFGAPSNLRCSAGQVFVARGTLEPGPLGAIVGDPLAAVLTAHAPGRLPFRGVAYPANYFFAYSTSVGATALVHEVDAALAACPAQRIVLVGYSQGAAVVDDVLGWDFTQGVFGGAATSRLPAWATTHVSAVVTFGNPLALFGLHISGKYSARAKEYCAIGDPICQPFGFDLAAHVSYGLDVPDAAAFILSRTPI
ncbi:cutinase [Frankineae bacterium MT45]|nr:cutinase [Frankineae bacterium MT45]